MKSIKTILSLVSIFTVCSTPYLLDAAETIANVANDSIFNSTTGTSLSWTGPNCVGSHLVGIVSGNGDLSSNADNITTATWGGQAMTRIGVDRPMPSDRWYYAFYILNPSSGAQTIVVNGSPSKVIGGLASCYSGIAQVAPEAASSSIATNVTSYTISAITISNNAWVIGTVDNSLDGGCSDAHLTTGTNDITTGGTNNAHNGPVAPAGSASLVCNTGSGKNFAGVIGVFAPFSANSFNFWQFFSF